MFDHGYALIIAVDQSSAPGAALPDVKKDADALCKVLLHHGLCGYAMDTASSSAKPTATRRTIPAAKHGAGRLIPD